MIARRAAAEAFVGLGANLENPLRQIRQAIAELDVIEHTRVMVVSSLYRSVPVGYAEQPDFINAVAKLQTRLSPHELLDALHVIENRHGRLRSVRNAPRTLDLDLLLYGMLVVHEEGLTLPHPRMHERAFVLLPLAEIAPDAPLPGHASVSQLLAQVDRSGVEKLDVA
ncbi:MAG: 2-amino-4-hydroxy-6-hydroxymethyldihydropteridine diphosphokinase [Betaproteobacteria bacterium]|nr:2-amino-4-hydroxy-6-hydroxymethyldihydropteridine diphosphokinase [Betaproteobacteria bacterium]